MNDSCQKPPSLSRRDRELALFALAATDPARAAGDYDALVEADEPWSLPVPIALADFIARRLPPADAEAFLARQTPVWPMFLESLARRFDPDGTGFVQWPSPGDDLFPEVAHPSTVAPDAAILLSNEARIYLDAAKSYKFRFKIDDYGYIAITDSLTGMKTVLLNDGGNAVRTSPALPAFFRPWPSPLSPPSRSS